MKILFLAKDFSYNGGGERMLANLANALCKTNEISVVSFDYTTKKPLYKLDETIDFTKVDIHRRKINFFTKVDYCSWLKKNRLFINSFDFVIGVGIICNLVLAVTSRKVNSGMLAWEHSSYTNVPLYQKMLRFFLFKRLDGVICLTYQDLQKYKRINKNSYVIYNFTQMPVVQRNCSNNKIFIWIGRLSKQKGICYLQGIIKKFCEHNEDWNFKIIGKGEVSQNFFAFIKKEKLENRILYESESCNVQKELDNSGCMLMTSLAEGLPMVLIEAQTRGVPAISFDTETGPREIIRDRENGFIIPCYDIDAFVEKMLQFVNSKDLRESMSSACFMSCGEFSEDKKVDQWLNFFNNLKYKC